MLDTTLPLEVRRPLAVTLGAYLRLTKPRVIELLLVTAVPPMFLAKQGVPSSGLMLAVVIGGAMAAVGANTINCWIERDRDQLMRRTLSRPLPQGEIVPSRALAFGVALNVVAFVLLASTANLLAASPHPLGHALLRLRLHVVAQAPHRAEHRDRRRGRCCARARRLGRGRGSLAAPGLAVLRGRLLLDARALLGVRGEVPRRLRRARASRCCPSCAASRRRPARSPPTR